MNSFVFRPTLGPEDAAALIAVHDACVPVDGVPSNSSLEHRPSVEWYRELLGKTDPENWVVAETAGRVVGYGHTLWDWPERDGTHVYLHLGYVEPNSRARGIGTELLARLEGRIHQRAATDGNAARAELGANAAETETAARELLAANGYFVGYTMLAMEYDNTRATPDIPLPAGYDLRPAEPEHYRAIWQCIGDAYDTDAPTGRFATEATEGNYQAYFHGERADRDLWFVAWRGSRIAGQVLCRINDNQGTVYEVSVGHRHRRIGLAGALLTRGLRALQDRGVSSIGVLTREDFPTQAWRLYEKHGFRTFKRFPRWRKAF